MRDTPHKSREHHYFSNLIPQAIVLKRLISRMVDDLTLLTDTEYAYTSQINAADKILDLLRDLYSENSRIFHNRIVEKINDAKKNLSIIKQKTMVGEKDLEVGFIFYNRKSNYKIIKLDDKTIEIELQNKKNEIHSLDSKYTKERIHKNIIQESRIYKLSRIVNNESMNISTIIRDLPNSSRISICHLCSSPVSRENLICYVCGWFICDTPTCTSCGCSYKK